MLAAVFRIAGDRAVFFLSGSCTPPAFGGCGCIGNGSSRNGPDDGADGGTPVSSPPASVAVSYQAADGTAYITSDGSSCEHCVRVAYSHLACAASAEDDGCCQDSYKRLFMFISYNYYIGQIVL